MKRRGETGTDIVITLLTISLVLSILSFVFKSGVLSSSAEVFTPYTTQKFESKPTNAEIEILNTAPQKTYIEIGEIKSYGMTEKIRIDKIVKKAREVGADAVVIKERTKDSTLAIAIKYK
jgi:hypothetical protein